MKQILIPTDFSENAENALQYAIDLYENQPIQIHLLSVINPDIVSTDLPISTIDLSSVQYENATKKLQALKEKYDSDSNSPKPSITIEAKINTVVFGISQSAKDVKADLIIMGTRGENHNYYDRLIGTISSEILKEAPCPVLLVPMGYTFKPIDNLIFATQLSHKDPYELWRATELLKPQVAQIRCLYVMKDRDNSNAQEIDQFAKYMVEHSPSIQTIFNIVEDNDIETAIEEYAETYDAEMILMHRSKKSFWENMFSKRHTKEMINLINRPLMIIK